jgi:hypothetical protein
MTLRPTQAQKFKYFEFNFVNVTLTSDVRVATMMVLQKPEC